MAFLPNKTYLIVNYNRPLLISLHVKNSKTNENN